MYNNVQQYTTPIYCESLWKYVRMLHWFLWMTLLLDKFLACPWTCFLVPCCASLQGLQALGMFTMWTMPMLCSVFLPWKQCVVFLDLSCYRTYHSFFAEIGAFFLPTATQSPFFALWICTVCIMMYGMFSCSKLSWSMCVTISHHVWFGYHRRPPCSRSACEATQNRGSLQGVGGSFHIIPGKIWGCGDSMAVSVVRT